MSTHRGPWMNHLDGLSHHFATMVESDSFGEHDRGDKKFTKILRDACHVVWDAEKRSPQHFPAIVEKAYAVIDKALKFGFSDLAMAHPDCYAHSKEVPVIQDSLQMTGGDIIEAVMDFYTNYHQPGTARPKLPDFANLTNPWTKTNPPHSRTTRLSRFRDGITLPTSDATPRARLVYQARTTIRAQYMSPPAAMAISADGSLLFMASSSGYRSRDPSLKYYNLDDDPELDNGRRIDPGLSNTPDCLVLDDERQLAFIADNDRIKSFRWGVSPSEGPGGAEAEGGKSKPRKRLPNVHTMNSEREYTGPLAVLPGGRVVRAGQGKAAVWNVDQLATHQDSPPGALLGEGTLNTDNSWREAGCAGIEHSSGIQPHVVVRFAEDPEFQPAVWHLHRPTGLLLCGERMRDTNGFACVAIDLEHGGRRAARYLGHGHDAEKFSTSVGEPNVFWTAAGDGFARMFDVRRPLPVLTFDTGGQSEGCADVVFVHPDGIPTLFTGGERTQQVKMWDVRARACVYELSTGNNGVVSMLWDDRHATLMAATERTSYGNKYRKAQIPRWATWWAIEQSMKDYQKLSQAPDASTAGDQTSGEVMDTASPPVPDEIKVEDTEVAEGHESDWEDDDEEEDDESGDEDAEEDDCENSNDIDEEYSKEKRWPERSYHNERFFGFGFDAHDAALFQYRFTEEPDWDMPASASLYGW
ncbi:hypothetical protein LXA43DRAFT_1147450 [Ganoderma leucocontextum]|nr:hypothetical protein LXA43DRAFT_1147450 [Ganoderma leucocontextum]